MRNRYIALALASFIALGAAPALGTDSPTASAAPVSVTAAQVAINPNNYIPPCDSETYSCFATLNSKTTASCPDEKRIRVRIRARSEDAGDSVRVRGAVIFFTAGNNDVLVRWNNALNINAWLAWKTILNWTPGTNATENMNSLSAWARIPNADNANFSSNDLVTVVDCVLNK